MNPCPCGYFGTDSCRCKETEVLKYLSKISGPILDRIDLHVELQPLSTKERMSPAKPGESAVLRKQVQEARECQHKRFGESGINCNAVIPGGQVFDFCQFSESASDHFASIIDEKKVSTRSMTRLAKVSRTIADLAKSDKVENSHIDEAAGFVVGGMLKDLF